MKFSSLEGKTLAITKTRRDLGLGRKPTALFDHCQVIFYVRGNLRLYFKYVKCN